MDLDPAPRRVPPSPLDPRSPTAKLSTHPPGAPPASSPPDLRTSPPGLPTSLQTICLPTSPENFEPDAPESVEPAKNIDPTGPQPFFSIFVDCRPSTNDAPKVNSAWCVHSGPPMPFVKAGAMMSRPSMRRTTFLWT